MYVWKTRPFLFVFEGWCIEIVSSCTQKPPSCHQLTIQENNDSSDSPCKLCFIENDVEIVRRFVLACFMAVRDERIYKCNGKVLDLASFWERTYT